MKQLIVLLAGILLGIFIFGLIMGNGDDSIKNSLKSVWQTEVEVRTQDNFDTD